MSPLPAPLSPELIERLTQFSGPILRTIGRRRPRRLASVYLEGLLGPGERKSTAPIAQRARGAQRAPAFERDMTGMLAEEVWSHDVLMWRGAAQLLRATSGWQAFAIDDTANLKQGDQSVGVANQYAGCVGGLANCQVIVTLDLAAEHVSTPLVGQLFLPLSWEQDRERRDKCKVPAFIHHQSKWQLALELLSIARDERMPDLPVLADCGYGNVSEFRMALTLAAWRYVVGVNLDTTVWGAGMRFEPLVNSKAVGRPASRLCMVDPKKPRDLATVACDLPDEGWLDVTWRHGTRGVQKGRFAAVRVRPARGYTLGGIAPELLQPEQWLLLHWPKGAAGPTKAWFSNLPETASLLELIRYARLRWRIERDYQEEKGLVGLDHFEGRSWPGLHHHLALVIVAHQFLALERYRALQQLNAPSPSLAPTCPDAAGFPPCSEQASV